MRPSSPLCPTGAQLVAGLTRLIRLRRQVAGIIWLALICCPLQDRAWPQSLEAQLSAPALQQPSAAVAVRLQLQHGEQTGCCAALWFPERGVIWAPRQSVASAQSLTVEYPGPRLVPLSIVLGNAEMEDYVVLLAERQAQDHPRRIPAPTLRLGEELQLEIPERGATRQAEAGRVVGIRAVPWLGTRYVLSQALAPESAGSLVLNRRGELVGVANTIAAGGTILTVVLPLSRLLSLPVTDPAPWSAWQQRTLEQPAASQYRLLRLALAQLWLGRYAAASAALQEFLRLAPQRQEAWFLLGLCYGEQGPWNREVEAYRQVLALAPDFLPARFALGQTYGDISMMDQAREEYRRLLDLQPSLASVRGRLALLDSLPGTGRPVPAVITGISRKFLLSLRVLDQQLQVQLFGLHWPSSPELAGKAWKFLRSRLLGKTISYQIRDWDVHGRSHAEIWLADGQSFNLILLREGWARCQPDRPLPPAWKGAEEEARLARRNLWKKGP